MPVWELQVQELHVQRLLVLVLVLVRLQERLTQQGQRQLLA